MAEDLLTFMHENWIHEAHIVGHSMGGKVAMKFALNNPDMVRKLVVVDIAPKVYEGNHETVLNALKGLDLDSLESRSEAETYFRKCLEEESTVQFLLKNLTREKDGNYRWKMNLPVITDHYQEILGFKTSNEQFEGETLFIRGEKSDYIIPEEFSSFLKLFPGAELKTISNAGHWVHAENSSDFLLVISEYLNK
jgi:pimeloyl-ACP methyl ester carboxylesterase